MIKLSIYFVLVVFILSINSNANPVQSDSSKLLPKDHYGSEANAVIRLLDSYHFKKTTFNDSLSSYIFDEYILSLDNNKMYFTKLDIEQLEKFRFSIDDLTKYGTIIPGYEIFRSFKNCFDARMNFLYNDLLKREYNFDIDEYYEIDRSKSDFAKNNDELNDIWRKSVKNQILSLKLNGKDSSEIYNVIKNRYDRYKKTINQYNSEDVFELYLNTICESYDPHTNYFSPRSSDRFREEMSLSLEGIGARLVIENDMTKVVEILPGGPAMKSNLIQPEDKILAVGQGSEGEMVNVIGWRLDEVVMLIKGKKGTTVRLEILPFESGHDGKTKIITLVREKINIEDRRAKAEIIPVIRNGIKYKMGVITIPSFYMDFDAYHSGDSNYTSTTSDVKKLLSDLNNQEIDGLVVDLRNNGGGALDEAINLTGLFIKQGPVVQIRSSTNKIQVDEDDDELIAYDGPLAVLINRFSASASEIFSAAIQDYSRGVILGETSFGKGTVQSVIKLSRFFKIPEKERAGDLKLTLQKFYRVTGSSTQHMGVSPDIHFPSVFDAKDFGESSYKKALEWDKIMGTEFEMTNKISKKIIDSLSIYYSQRLHSDKNLIEMTNEVNKLKETMSKTMISLNESVRINEREIDNNQNKRSENTISTKIVTNEENSLVIDNIDEDDKYLREGIAILSDMISIIG